MKRRVALLFIGLLAPPTQAFSNGYGLRTLRPSESPNRQPLHFKTQQRMVHVNANMTELRVGTLDSSNSWFADDTSSSPIGSLPAAKVQRDDTISTIMDSYWGPRIVLGLVPVLYGKIYNIMFRMVDIISYTLY